MPRHKQKKKRKPVRRQPHWNGHPALSSRRLRRTVIRANKRGLVVTATSDGVHSATSYHSQRRAVDLGFSAHDLREKSAGQRRRIMVEFQKSEYRRARTIGWFTYREIIGPDNTYNVLRSSPTSLAEGTSLEQMHDNHVHVAR
jgi:hypothetical protein